MSCDRCGTTFGELNRSDFGKVCRDCFVLLQRGPTAIAPGDLPAATVRVRTEMNRRRAVPAARSTG